MDSSENELVRNSTQCLNVSITSRANKIEFLLSKLKYLGQTSWAFVQNANKHIVQRGKNCSAEVYFSVLSYNRALSSAYIIDFFISNKIKQTFFNFPRALIDLMILIFLDFI